MCAKQDWRSLRDHGISRECGGNRTDLIPLIGNRMQRGSLRVPHQGPCDPQNTICAAAYLWSVGHANARHLETFEAIIDVFLVVNVQMRRALVQKEDSRLSIECSREHHSLLLSA